MILCEDTAYKILIDDLVRRGFRVSVQGSPNKGRHRIIDLQKGNLEERWYLLYKRDWFNTFGKQFPELINKFGLSENTKGESINRDSLTYAIASLCDKIAFCHQDGFYMAFPLQIKSFSTTHELIRTQDKSNEYKAEGGSRVTVNEVTYSFPCEFGLLNKLEVEQ